MPTDLRLGLGTKLVVWLTVCGVCVLPTNLNLFSAAISCTLVDKDDQSKSFTKSTQFLPAQGKRTLTSVQATSTGNAYELDHISFNKLASELRADTQQSTNTSDNTLKNALQVGIDAITQPFTISTRLKDSFTTTLKTAYQQKVTFDSSSLKTAQSSNPSFKDINWSTVEPSPIGRHEAQGGVVNGKLYVFSGYTDLTYTPTRRADVYDPAAINKWRRIQNMPFGLTHAGTAVDEVNDDIYLAGGYIEQADGTGQTLGTNKVLKYDVNKNTWSSMPSLPAIRGAGALALLNGELHFFGGRAIGVPLEKRDRATHWVLQLGKTEWTPAAPLPEPRNHLGDATLGGKIYAIGGQTGNDKTSVAQSSVYVWQGKPGTRGTWTKVAPLPRGRQHISAATFVMDGRIIAAGGEYSHNEHVTDVTAYNPLSNSWTKLTPLPQVRASGIADNIGNKIFYTTGAPRKADDSFQSTTFKGVPVLISPAQSSNLQIPRS